MVDSDGWYLWLYGDGFKPVAMFVCFSKSNKRIDKENDSSGKNYTKG